MDKYSERLQVLESLGFIKEKGCITNGTYAFLYHQIDTSEITDEQFAEFVDVVKKSNQSNGKTN
jgi:predicted transcriptional regulator